ncbi:MAG: protein translocase subunit SecF [Acidobacteria bacterium]|nr:protein translocase subunit SecF [Acidobacteriota bacterium]
MHIFKDANYDFLRWRWHALAVSWVIIITGIFTIVTKGIPKGVEFAGGTVVIEQFDQAVSVQQVRQALDRNYAAGGQNTVVQTSGDPAQRMIMIRVPQVGAESGADLSREAQQVEDALAKANIGAFHRQGAEIVGATVGAELTSKGLWATALSLVGILAYLAFRFQFSFGVGAVIATIHDLLITLAFLAFFRYDMSLNVIAAILTMTGYSTNDTIVIFDRIRENMRSMRRDSLGHIINASVNQTLSRTIITAGTALLTSLALFFFGGGAFSSPPPS